MQKHTLISQLKQLRQTLKEEREKTAQVLAGYQQEKNKLLLFRNEADLELRLIKLQGEQTLNEIRQEIAKVRRESQKNLGYLRRQWSEHFSHARSKKDGAISKS